MITIGNVVVVRPMLSFRSQNLLGTQRNQVLGELDAQRHRIAGPSLEGRPKADADIDVGEMSLHQRAHLIRNIGRCGVKRGRARRFELLLTIEAEHNALQGEQPLTIVGQFAQHANGHRAAALEVTQESSLGQAHERGALIANRPE